MGRQRRRICWESQSRSLRGRGGRPTIRCLAPIPTALALGDALTPLRIRGRTPPALLSRVDTGKTGDLASRTGHLAAHQRCGLTTRIVPHLATPTSITRLGCTGDGRPRRSRRRHQPQIRRGGRPSVRVDGTLFGQVGSGGLHRSRDRTTVLNVSGLGSTGTILIHSIDDITADRDDKRTRQHLPVRLTLPSQLDGSAVFCLESLHQ